MWCASRLRLSDTSLIIKTILLFDVVVVGVHLIAQQGAAALPLSQLFVVVLIGSLRVVLNVRRARSCRSGLPRFRIFCRVLRLLLSRGSTHGTEFAQRFSVVECAHRTGPGLWFFDDNRSCSKGRDPRLARVGSNKTILNMIISAHFNYVQSEMNVLAARVTRPLLLTQKYLGGSLS